MQKISYQYQFWRYVRSSGFEYVGIYLADKLELTGCFSSVRYCLHWVNYKTVAQAVPKCIEEYDITSSVLYALWILLQNLSVNYSNFWIRSAFHTSILHYGIYTQVSIYICHLESNRQRLKIRKLHHIVVQSDGVAVVTLPSTTRCCMVSICKMRSTSVEQFQFLSKNLLTFQMMKTIVTGSYFWIHYVSPDNLVL